MNDKERENQIILAWAIRMGLANKYEDLDKSLTKREFLKILYKLLVVENEINYTDYVGGIK